MGNDFPVLYPYSRAEAERRNESRLWDLSFHTNVQCARDIEAAIRISTQADRLKSDCAESVLAVYGFKCVSFVLGNTLKELGSAVQIGTGIREMVHCGYIPRDADFNRYYAVDTATASLEAFIRQTDAAYQKLELFGAAHCIGDRHKLDFTGKVLVLSPDTLRESCWTPQNQLWYAHDGFGCSPNAIGRSIRSTCLGDGEMTRWNRADFIGVLDEQHLPDWAAERLAELREPEQTQTGGMTMG